MIGASRNEGVMKFQKAMLWLLFAVWFIFGAGYLAAPAFFASLVDMELTAPNALIDVRGLYGGQLLGIAAWFGYCAVSDKRLYLGVTSAFLIVAGLFAGRLVGVAVDGGPNGVNLFYVIIEGVVSMIMFAAVRMGDLSKR